MKKYLFLATAIATASLFTGCSNNEYVGDQPEAFNGTDGAIAFSMGKANTTRVEQEKAANNYFEHFYVYGEKTPSAGGSAVPVFNTYKVKYADVSTNTTNSTASNTKGWEYVWTNPWGDNERTNVNGGVDNQTIKYWDYSASKYTFYAFSANSIDVTGTAPKITVSKIDKTTSTDPSYTVTIKKDASIGDLYFADKKEVEKNDYAGQGGTPADKAVQLKFRNLAAKVRVGFYETVPGYKIKIKQMSTECPNYKASTNSTITVKYKEAAGSYIAYVFDKAQSGSSTWQASSTLTLGTGVVGSELKTTSSSPTWDTDGGKYTFFWPQETNNTPLKITVDYTLTSTDNSGEEINVKGATATVPADYVQWAANTAYTYIFKISDKTNGSTGGEGGTEGLYPITFDAVVVDYANEGSTTTVSTPSVTAKQDGATNGYVDANGIVFQTGTPIDLKVMNGGSDVTSGAKITGDYITSYDYNMTPDQNLKAYSKDIKTDQSTSLTVPDNSGAGYWVLKVATSDDSGAATTYVIIRVGDAEVGPANQ